MEILIYCSTGNEYAYYEKRNRSKFNLRCIDGQHTSCGNCVGYCRFAGHEGFLTRQLRKEHDCIVKKCNYYIPKPKNR